MAIKVKAAWIPDGMMGCLVLLTLLLLLCGCAGGRPSKGGATQERWACDPQADEAVEYGDHAAGLVLHEALVKREPGNALALYHLGYLLGQAGKHAREVSCYQRALALGLDYDDQLYFNLGMALLELGRSEDAASAFEQAIALAPQNADGHFGLAMAMARAQRFGQAEKALLQVLALDPEHPYAASMLEDIRQRP